MKKKCIVLLLTAFTLIAFKRINDVITDIGTTLEVVKKETVEKVFLKDFSVPYCDKNVKESCKKLPPGVREATMLSLGKLVKAYVESPEFQKDYFSYVERNTSVTPFDTADARWAEKRKSITEDLNRMVSNPDAMGYIVQNFDIQIQTGETMLDLAKENPQVLPKKKEEYEQDIKNAKLLKDLYAQDKEAFKKKYIELELASQMKNEMENTKKQHDEELKRREDLKNYKPIIKKELEEFLNESSAVDFDAKIKPQGDMMVFVNPAYETKPDAWKFCYRIGREATAGARKFAQDWLNSLK